MMTFTHKGDGRRAEPILTPATIILNFRGSYQNCTDVMNEGASVCRLFTVRRGEFKRPNTYYS